MKIGRLFAVVGMALVGTILSQPGVDAATALQTVAVATSATGQSGYLAELIEVKGIAREHGLKINNMMMDFTEAGNALRLGRAVAGMMQPSTALNLRKSGTDVRLFVAQVWSGNAFVVRKDAPYKSLADLKGKKIGNFSRVTGAYFFSAVIAKESGLDIEKDFKAVPSETGALLALLERGEVEAINMFEPHVARLVLSGKYRVLVDFDSELQRIFGTPPLKTGFAVLKETAEKQPELVKAIRAAYIAGIKVVKSGQDKEFFESKAKEFFGLKTPEEVAAGMKRNRENFADVWGPAFFEGQNKILQKGIALGLLPDGGNLNDLWIK
ncbi:MAG TPA: PhnD/SsuA/transferrin family substrate-binding protein [Candidatus Binatia bacterium]|nr:PhnD/SsuA/transferrin family substrate-binding protein [Candidatus Binatia bacterium]